MRRLFFALWPDQNIRAQINAINLQINEHRLKKLRPTNLHTTLVFMGNVDEPSFLRLQQHAQAIRANAFTITFDQLNYWQKPKILCLTCQRQPKEIYQLVNQLTDIVEAEGIDIEERPYRAHVTLARKASQIETVSFTPVVWQVTEFVLAESISTDKGVVYQVLARWPLQQD